VTAAGCADRAATATDLFLDGKSEDLIEHLAKMPPMERLARPESVTIILHPSSSRNGFAVVAWSVRSGARVSKDGPKARIRGHPSRRIGFADAPQDEG
jgi:hypothetical protein